MHTIALAGMIEFMVETRGQRLRARRDAARIRQDELAERAHVSIRVLQDLEAGKDAERNMRKTADAVERALTAILSEMPAPEGASPDRRLRAVKAYIRDEEDVVGVTAHEVRPGVREMRIVLLDSDVPVDDAMREELLRILNAEQADRPNG